MPWWISTVLVRWSPWRLLRRRLDEDPLELAVPPYVRYAYRPASPRGCVYRVDRLTGRVKFLSPGEGLK
ncbi:MAG TPA: hypothetical protein GXX28_09485 [Firmicutes bacterium]|nr:hypothetical protein [Bacillota bacterium]